MEKTSFKDFLETDFTLTLLNLLLPIAPLHLRELIKIENANIDYYEFGTDKEKYLKNVMRYYGRLGTVAEDLDFVIIFLKFNKRKSITELFPSLEKQENYYTYHFENYIMRINSIPDMCSKLLNAVFELNITERDCGWYKVIKDSRVKNEESSKTLKLMSDKIEVIRAERHNKLHKGELRNNPFDRVIFYDKILKTGIDPILDDFTDEQISTEVEKIKKDITELFILLSQFLNSLLVHLNTKI